MEPIIVLGMPRSGSSMAAGLFAEHGVWTGSCREPSQYNGKGFFENFAIKKVIIKMQGPIVHDGLLGQPMPGFRELVEAAIKRDGYESGPWLWKGSALYWPCFYEFQPTWVLCRRPSQQIFDSCRSSGIFGKDLSDERLREIIDLHQKVMDNLATGAKAFQVDTWKVAQGDYTSIISAVNGCGLEFDYDLTRAFVDSSMWHHQ